MTIDLEPENGPTKPLQGSDCMFSQVTITHLMSCSDWLTLVLQWLSNTSACSLPALQWRHGNIPDCSVEHDASLLMPVIAFSPYARGVSNADDL